MQGIQSNLINKVEVSVKLLEFLAGKARCTVTLNDPLKTSYSLTGLKADVFFKVNIFFFLEE